MRTVRVGRIWGEGLLSKIVVPETSKRSWDSAKELPWAKNLSVRGTGE